MTEMTFTFGDLQTDSHSSLAYRWRLPQPSSARGVVVLLHGLGSHEMDLASLAAKLDPELQVLLVRAPLVLGPGQYGWFSVNFSAQGSVIDAKAAETSRLQLVALLQGLQQGSALPVWMAGFSQGGIMSASVALTEPKALRGFGILSGRILPELDGREASPDQLVHLHAWISHGEQDTRLPISWAERASRKLTELGITHERNAYSAGHEITAAMQADFADWLRRNLA